ncbi:MAG: hypothetical protein Q9224_005953 [Gallowayella concinna]
MSTYHFSRAVTDAELERWAISTTMDVRVHKQEHLAYQGIQEILDELAATLDIFENTTDTQRRQGTLEGSEDFQSVLELKGLPKDALKIFPQLKKQFIDYVKAKDPIQAKSLVQEVTRIATAPPRDQMEYDTIESYMELRMQDSSMKSVSLILDSFKTEILITS